SGALASSGRGIITFRRALMHSMPALALLGVKMLAMRIAMNSLDFAKQANDLIFLSNSAGMATDKLQRLGGVSKRNGGGGTQSVATAMGNLRKRVYNSQYEMDSGLAQLQSQYKIQISDGKGMLSAEQIMKNALDFIFDRNKSIDAKNKVKELVGMDDGMFNAAMRGRGYYEAEQRKAAEQMLSPEDIKRLDELHGVFKDFSADIEKMAKEMAIDNADGVRNLLESFKGLMNTIGNNAESIKAAADGILTLCKWIIDSVSGIVKAAEWVGEKAGEAVGWTEKTTNELVKNARETFSYGENSAGSVSNIPRAVAHNVETTFKGGVTITISDTKGNKIGETYIDHAKPIETVNISQ
ncbi:MAG: hypothetical protein J5706_01250, partial [Elusimicrobiales bacterium]|nr:hypothetical protein [Elusimicrobiales bacterium]